MLVQKRKQNKNIKKYVCHVYWFEAVIYSEHMNANKMKKWNKNCVVGKQILVVVCCERKCSCHFECGVVAMWDVV